MRAVRAFPHFWYDFIIGDDWRIAIGVVVAKAPPSAHEMSAGTIKLAICPGVLREVTIASTASRPISSVMRPFSTFRTVVPVNRIVLPVSGGSEPMGQSPNASPVWVPPPSHWPTT